MLREWVGSAALLMATAALASGFGWLSRFDQTLYDAGIALLGRAAPSDVVIVAIDQPSLERIGRWPWRRGVHATLLDRLTDAGVRAVAFDMILAEPDAGDPAGDAALARAMARNGRVVLPVLMETSATGTPRAVPPAALFARVARVGHVHLELDRDGIARSVYLREGPGAAQYEHLALALASAGGAALGELPGVRRPGGQDPAGGYWTRDYWTHIAFLGPPGSVTRVPYVDVLLGTVDSARLKGRYVFVGATAAGMLDAYPTPVSGQARAMPGVEISANVLAGLLERRFVRIVPAWMQAIGSALMVLALLVGYLRLSARRSLLASVIAVALALVFALALLRAGGWWFAPSSAMLCLLACYPLWSWRRLEAAQRHMEEELRQFSTLPVVLPVTLEPGLERSHRVLGGEIEARIEQVRAAGARLRDAHRLVSEMLNGLPSAAMIVDAGHRVVLANARTASFLGIPVEALQGRTVNDVLAPLGTDGDAGWAALLDASGSREARLPDGRDLLVHTVRFSDSADRLRGRLVSLVDVSSLKQAERRREEYLRFLSHDLRSPLVSILALLELQALAPEAVGDDFLPRVRRSVERSLALAEDFVQLGRAEAIDPARFSHLDLADVLEHAVEEMGVQAQAKTIELVFATRPAHAPSRGARDVLHRVFVNLISNAVKYSPEGTRVQCSIEAADGFWNLVFADQGHGIAPEDLPRLFDRFERLDAAKKRGAAGAGLGLAFVKAAVDRHGGRIEVASAPGQGSRFVLRLPQAAEQPEAAGSVGAPLH